MLGVQGEEAALQTERLDQFRRRRNFVAFLVDHQIQRITLWLRRKHDKTTWAELFRQYAQSRSGKRKRWQHGKRQIALFTEAHQKRFPDRGIRIPNGWNATPDEWFLNGADKFWEATNTLALL